MGAPSDQAIDEAVKLIGDNADIEDKGEVTDYVGVHIERQEDGTIALTQPQLIQSILKELHLDPKESKPVPTPALSSTVVHADLEGEPHDGHFNYRTVLGKLYYLTQNVADQIVSMLYINVPDSWQTPRSPMPKQSNILAGTY